MRGEKRKGRRRPRLFISYSRGDLAWLELFYHALKEVDRNDGVDVWDDRRIQPGSRWEDQIREAIADSDAVVFMLSAAMVRSDSIKSLELPGLLNRVELVFWFPIDDADPSSVGLDSYQAVHTKPLAGMKRSLREMTLRVIAQKIISAMLK